MPDYIVVFDQTVLASSDAAVGTKPTPTSEITAPVERAKVAYVTADSVEDAHAAVGQAYNASTNVPVVYPNKPVS